MATKKKHILEFTDKELICLCHAVDNISAMIGGADDDSEFETIVKNLDRMLKRNGYKRLYN